MLHWNDEKKKKKKIFLIIFILPMKIGKSDIHKTLLLSKKKNLTSKYRNGRTRVQIREIVIVYRARYSRFHIIPR